MAPLYCSAVTACVHRCASRGVTVSPILCFTSHSGTEVLTAATSAAHVINCIMQAASKNTAVDAAVFRELLCQSLRDQQVLCLVMGYSRVEFLAK
jgi:hypothetical protein